MAHTTILLREDLDTVGGRGEIVKVRAGFARNYLLPQGLATLATKGNIKQIEQERSALLKKAAIDVATAEAQREQMETITLNFERLAGDHGTLFGSVTSMDIAEALQSKGYEIDRRKIVLKDAIKEIGEFTVNVKLHREVTLTVPVIVTAEVSPEDAKADKKAKKETKAAPEEIKAEAPVEEVASETKEMDGEEQELPVEEIADKTEKS